LISRCSFCGNGGFFVGFEFLSLSVLVLWAKEKKMKFKNSATLVVVLLAVGAVSADIADFDDLSLSPDSYWNGSDGTGDFTSGSAVFNNNFTDWGYGITSWDGWAYSNKSDTTTPGYTNQYSAITGSAQSSSNYGVAYVGWTEPPSITLNSVSIIEGIYVTNTTYAYLAMENGEGPATKFDDEDWFKLTIIGLDESGSETGTVDFYLAEAGYIVNTWECIGLSSLGIVKGLKFALSSSDNGDYGMNTPAYFAMDTVIPEPATVILFGLGGLLLRRRRK
jgi:hypothetical protein